MPARIDEARRVANQFNLSFTALPGQNYAVQFSGSLPAGSWQPLAYVAAPPVVTRVLVVDPITSTQRCYRVMVYEQVVATAGGLEGELPAATVGREGISAAGTAGDV